MAVHKQLSSGENEEVKTPRKKQKKEQKIAKIVIQRLCVTMRATEAFGSRNNTEYFLSGEATTLNTSWMKQNLVMCSQIFEKNPCRLTARHWRTRPDSTTCTFSLEEQSHENSMWMESQAVESSSCVQLRYGRAANNTTLEYKTLLMLTLHNHLKIRRGWSLNDARNGGVLLKKKKSSTFSVLEQLHQNSSLKQKQRHVVVIGLKQEYRVLSPW